MDDELEHEELSAGEYAPATSSEELGDRILRDGFVPAANELVHLSIHAEKESVRNSAAQAVIRYNLARIKEDAERTKDAPKPDASPVDPFDAFLHALGNEDQSPPHHAKRGRPKKVSESERQD